MAAPKVKWAEYSTTLDLLPSSPSSMITPRSLSIELASSKPSTQANESASERIDSEGPDKTNLTISHGQTASKRSSLIPPEPLVDRVKDEFVVRTLVTNN